MIHTMIAIVLAGLLVSDLMLALAGRLKHCIRLVAFQGIVLGCLTWLAGGGERAVTELGVMALVNFGVKAVALPWLLTRAVRMTQVKREVEPLVSYSASLLIAAGAMLGAFWICGQIDLPAEVLSPLALPTALSTMFVGLFLIVSRRKAITQAIGFLVFENGIGVFGLGCLVETGMIVELGILLDVLVLVFVMGITVFHIRREFQHIDADKLTALGDRDEPGRKGALK